MQGAPKFPVDRGFQRELKRRVDEYFRTTGLSPRDNRRMYLKSAAILTWFLLSYVLLVFVATNWWEGLLASLSLSFAMAGIGFSIQHDANHGAYSQYPIVNRMMGMTLDLLGASSYMWHWKHNISHHTYPNVSGADEDIELGPLGRLAPAQPRYRFHALQSIYLWALYGLLVPGWHFVYDFKKLVRGKIGRNRFPRPRGWTLWGIVGGKLFFLGWAFVVPLQHHSPAVVIGFYFGNSFVLSIIMSVVFQLAHVVEEANFVTAPVGTRNLSTPWAVHQVETTVNFAPANRLLTWYLGGLNYQIEHHLFPKVCHIHYPQLSRIVQAVCAEYGVGYAGHDRFLAALSSHWRWLHRMGQPLES